MGRKVEEQVFNHIPQKGPKAIMSPCEGKNCEGLGRPARGRVS